MNKKRHEKNANLYDILLMLSEAIEIFNKDATLWFPPLPIKGSTLFSGFKSLLPMLREHTSTKEQHLISPFLSRMGKLSQS